MYMMGENPFLSDPNINKVRKALSALDFLAVQDIFLTETAEFADVVLPASSYLEKDGSYTNTDRRVQRGRKVLDPPGEARVDWEIIQVFANRVDYEMNYSSAEEIFDELVSLMPNYTNLTYGDLGPTGSSLNADPDTPTGDRPLPGSVRHRRRARASGARRVDARPGAAQRGVPLVPRHRPSARALAHRLDDAAVLRADSISPKATIFINPIDAERLGIADGELLE